MGVRSLGAAAAALGMAVLAVPLGVAPAAAQGPGQGPGAGPRPGTAVRPGLAGRPGGHRPGRGFSGRGFRQGAGYGGLAAGGLYPWGPYGGGYGGYGAGAPTNVDASVRTYPSPDELAPAAWSYGTYGIPTVPGIAPPPKGDPVVYVIDGGRRAARPDARVAARSHDGWVDVDPQPTAGGARVVSVRVPR